MKTPAYGPDGCGAYIVTWDDGARPYTEKFYFRGDAVAFAVELKPPAQNVRVARGQMGEGYPRPSDWEPAR